MAPSAPDRLEASLTEIDQVPDCELKRRLKGKGSRLDSTFAATGSIVFRLGADRQYVVLRN